MKRTTALTAFVAAGVLLLAGCGKDSGTATPVSDTAAAVSSPDTGATADGDTTDTSAEATDSPTEATDSPSEATDSPSEPTDSSDGTESAGSEDSSAEQTTIGSNGDLDDTTKNWFSSFCDGMAPVAGMKDIQSKLDMSDPKKTFKALAEAMSQMGEAFTSSASKLKSLPAPTFDGGDEFATKIVTTFGELGPKFTELGKKFAEADPTDPSSMSGLASIGTDLQDATKPLQEMQNLKIDSATQAAIAEIPSCKKLNG